MGTGLAPQAAAATPIFEIKKGLARDGVQVYADRIVIVQRTMGRGGIFIPRRDITEVRSGGFWSIDGRGYRVNLRVGSKKYVIRHLGKDEAHGLADALAG